MCFLTGLRVSRKNEGRFILTHTERIRVACVALAGLVCHLGRLKQGCVALADGVYVVRANWARANY